MSGLEGVLDFLERHPDAIEDIENALARAAAHAHQEARAQLLAEEDRKFTMLAAESASYRNLRSTLQSARAS